MPTSVPAQPVPHVHWVDHQLRLESIPGTLLRHGRYLYLRADSSAGVLADGHVVDGLQLVRTDRRNPTQLESRGVRFRGVERHGSVGIELVEAGVVSPRDRSWLRQPFEPAAVAVLDGPVLDEASRTLEVDGQVVRFSDVEFGVVSLLLRHPGLLITREELSVHAWGRPLQTSDQVTSAIKRIRVRLRQAGIADPITTVHALGYRWEQISADHGWQDLGRTG